MSDLKPFLGKLAGGARLSEAEAEEAFEIIMSGGATPSQIGAFLMALRLRGETVAEITAAARLMRAKVAYVPAPAGAIDIVGTGGDASGTLNISTGAALVAAGAGVPVAKHGNRALSSKSGAADVLTALGVNVEADFALIARSIREAGMGFLMAPRHHAATRHVAPARVEMGTRTIFNLLGPLSNPSLVKRLLVGVYAREWTRPMAEALGKLGAERAWVVHGSDGLDEMTTTGATYVAEYRDGMVREFEVTPEEAGLPRATPEQLKGADAAFNAKAVHALLAGDHGPYRNVVLFEAAAALVVAEKARDLKEGVAIGADSLDSGKAKRALERMVAISNEAVPAQA
jgi:anthranilate phosphoribosyltransferase